MNVLGGRYALHEQLGSGGMGSVFRATQLRLRRQVALKIMHEPLTSSPALVERFVREARALVLLDHPNVVRIFDLGDVDGRPFIAMELLSGMTLSSWMATFQPGLPPVEPVLELLAQACDGLAAAHAAGLVHRDLKPENLWVVGAADVPPQLKILDFGLVHLAQPMTEATLTHVNDVAGTPNYMSPEQCRSLRVGPSADLYALGCVLHRALSGREPFVADNAIDVIAKQMYAPIPGLERPEGSEPIHPSIEALRQSLLEKQPERRPASAALVARTLREYMHRPASDSGLPVRASRPPRGEVFPSANRSAAIEPLGGEASLLRLDTTAPGLSDADLLALGIAGVRVDVQPSLADSSRARLLLIDAGSQPAGVVVGALRELRARNPDLGCVVCARNLDARTIAELVEAGASELVPLPATAAQLIARVARLQRRRTDSNG